MICPDCGYNMVPDNSDYGYGCVVCDPPEEGEEGEDDSNREGSEGELVPFSGNQRMRRLRNKK